MMCVNRNDEPMRLAGMVKNTGSTEGGALAFLLLTGKLSSLYLQVYVIHPFQPLSTLTAVDSPAVCSKEMK